MKKKKKIAITFIEQMNNKYKPKDTKFSYFDDYSLWLFYKKFGKDENRYYERLEKDLKSYSDSQTGTEREKEKQW